MNSAVAILLHALRQLLQSPVTTLRVILPALLVIAGTGLLVWIAAPGLLAFGFAQAGSPAWPSGSTGLMWLALLLMGVFGYALMAILWHRHGLTDGKASRPGIKLVLAYLWRVLLLSLIQILISIVIVIPLLISLATGDGESPGPSLPAMLLTTFLAGLLLIWLSLRLSLVLPAAALGDRMGFAESWATTAPIVRPLWGVAALLAALNTLLSGLIGLIGAETPLVTLLIETPIYIAQGLLIFSVLTTLYGLLVQDRQTELRSVRHGL